MTAVFNEFIEIWCDLLSTANSPRICENAGACVYWVIRRAGACSRRVIPPSARKLAATSLYKGGKLVSISLSPLQRGKRRSRRGIGGRQ